MRAAGQRERRSAWREHRGVKARGIHTRFCAQQRPAAPAWEPSPSPLVPCFPPPRLVEGGEGYHSRTQKRPPNRDQQGAWRAARQVRERCHHCGQGGPGAAAQQATHWLPPRAPSKSAAPRRARHRARCHPTSESEAMPTPPTMGIRDSITGSEGLSPRKSADSATALGRGGRRRGRVSHAPWPYS